MMQLGFYQFSKAWYYEINKSHIENNGVIDEIMIGNYNIDGGCEYEFKIHWKKLSMLDDPVPQLCVFDDAWKGLYENHQDLLNYMADQNNKQISPDRMYNVVLSEMGYVDLTQYEQE